MRERRYAGRRNCGRAKHRQRFFVSSVLSEQVFERLRQKCYYAFTTIVTGHKFEQRIRLRQASELWHSRGKLGHLEQKRAGLETKPSGKHQGETSVKTGKHLHAKTSGKVAWTKLPAKSRAWSVAEQSKQWNKWFQNRSNLESAPSSSILPPSARRSS